jgi:hypothetical protein
MSDFTILMDSSKTTQTSDNFEIYLNQPIKLKGVPHEVGMVSLFTWYTWFNISADYSNNTFKYSPDGGLNWSTETIPSGNYTIDQLEDAIHALMKANGDVTDPDTPDEAYDINFAPNYSTVKLYIELTNSYQIDFTVGNLYTLLGFSSAALTSSAYGPENVNITNNVNTMLLHCSLINGGSFDNGSASDNIYSFVPAVPPGANL